MKCLPRVLFKSLAWMGAAAMLACLGACGGGGGSDAPGGGGGTLTSSSITLPSNVQVVTTH